MAKRTSIYLSPPLDELLLAHAARGDDALRSASALLASVVDRYLDIVRRNLPDWTTPQWCLAADALNGCWLSESPGSALSIVQMEISDAVELNGADEKWGVDWAVFRPALILLTHTQAIAVIEVVERFWCDPSLGADDMAALVQSVRSRMATPSSAPETPAPRPVSPP